ncbi:MAG TPA: M20 family metallopeptidase [Chitinophagaceae bacterium]
MKTIALYMTTETISPALGTRVTGLKDELTELRQWLHRIPELGFAEKKTAYLVETILRDLGCEVTTGVGGTGVIGTLYGKKNGPSIALRACLDALPIEEMSGVSYSSEHGGCMHACGHDGNMTMVLGAAKVLASYKGRLNGNIKFIFQPSEEDTGGAAEVIKAGGLKDPDVGFIVTPHNWHGIPLGAIVVKPGAMLASCDLFTLKITGKAGHGAWPHLAVDPIVIAAEVITALQRIVAREIDPMKPALVSIGTINGGTAANIIPDAVVLEGTVRTLDAQTRDFIEKRIEEIVRGITAAAQGGYELKYQRVMPPGNNDRELCEQVRSLLRSTMGDDVLTDDFEPSMGCEEFSLYQEQVPGLFMFIGNDKPGEEIIPIHSPHYVFNDEILENGVRALSEIALWYTGSK